MVFSVRHTQLVTPQILRHTHRNGYAVNDAPVTDHDAEGYEGAIVIEHTRLDSIASQLQL